MSILLHSKIKTMKHFILSFVCCLLASFSYGDVSPIMVCNAAGTTCTPYYNIDTAYTAANNGDYIYVPGGIFVLNVNINKEIHMIGAGHNFDSTMVTNFTTINSNITFDAGGNNSSLEGLYITGGIYGPSSVALNNLTVSYCHANLFNCYITNSTIRTTIFRGGGIGDNTFYYGINNAISNCFLYSISNLNSSLVENCTGFYYINNVALLLMKNNIFYSSPYSPYGQYGSNNSWNNNVFVNACPYYCTNFINANNNIQVNLADLFTNGFDYYNMHLVANSPGLTAGTGGTQVGVYGGLFPYKEGAVPSNPHVYQKTISASTNASGQLPVQIKVRAENY